MESLHKRLASRDELKWVGPIGRAEWLREIADRGRSLEEIADIAPQIGALSLLYDRPDAKWLIRCFDRILRLYGEPASESQQVAATIHASVNASAASFPEMLEAFIAVLDSLAAEEASA